SFLRLERAHVHGRRGPPITAPLEQRLVPRERVREMPRRIARIFVLVRDEGDFDLERVTGTHPARRSRFTTEEPAMRERRMLAQKLRFEFFPTKRFAEDRDRHDCLLILTGSGRRAG